LGRILGGLFPVLRLAAGPGRQPDRRDILVGLVLVAEQLRHLLMKEVLRHGLGITLGYRRHYRRWSGGGLRGHPSSVADVAAVRRSVVWRWMQLRRQAKRRPRRLRLTPAMGMRQ
jgi:hypothetical protein